MDEGHTRFTSSNTSTTFLVIATPSYVNNIVCCAVCSSKSGETQRTRSVTC